MGYGPTKLASPAVKETIIAAIRERLEQSDNFKNDALGFYGVEFDFKMDITFHARLEDKLSIEVHQSHGEVPPDAVTTHEVLTGSHSAGRTKKKAS